MNRDSKESYKVRSKHVVAYDGAKSAVRSFLGIESEGEDLVSISSLLDSNIPDINGLTRRNNDDPSHQRGSTSYR